MSFRIKKKYDSDSDNEKNDEIENNDSEQEVEAEEEEEEEEEEVEAEEEGEEDDIDNEENIDDDVEADDIDDEYEEKIYDNYDENDDNLNSESELKEEENDDLENCFYQYDNLVYEYEDDKPPTQVSNEDRITLNRITKYELVRILGIRAKQISVGAKVLVKNIQAETPIEIAIYELQNKMTPFIIKRPLPNNTFELWNINEMEIDIDINDILNITSFSSNAEL